MSNALLDAAIEWAELGFHVVPAIRGKRPAAEWKAYQLDAAPTADDVVTWASTADGIGVICGTDAGLEMLEVEGRAVGTLEQVAALAYDNDLADLWSRVFYGYMERTPSGGLHWYYRVEGGAQPNRKLARRPNTAGGVDVLWETRGQGGFSVIAPSAGSIHDTIPGGAWTVVHGTPATIPTITAAERDALHALISMLDEMPPIDAPAPMAESLRHSDTDALRPGDDYNNRGTWDELLTPLGWRRMGKMGDGWTWQRPGKDGPGISATTGTSKDGADRLYVFSTSTVFNSERPYSKFAAYALLHHGGDYSAAGRALRAQGYGEQVTAPTGLAGILASGTPVSQVTAQPHTQGCKSTTGRPYWIDTGSACDCPAFSADDDASAPQTQQDAPESDATPPQAPGAALNDELAADRLLAEMVYDLQRRERARQIVAEIREIKHPKPPPDVGTIAELLARPEAESWRIEGLLPAAGRMLFTAQRKTGKTTAVGNLARSLIDGNEFLGAYHATPIAEGRRIAVLNYEVSGSTFARWMEDVGVAGDRMYVENLRGCANPLATEDARNALVDRLRAVGAEILIVDPFGRAYSGDDQNNAAMVTPWLVTLDQVAEQAGCTELILTAHAGWNGERTRGSSALEDWPDVIVTMTKDAETGQRYIRAEGRDVDISEDRLEYNEYTRAYIATGDGSKSQAAERAMVDRLVEALVDTVTRNPGLGTRAIARKWREEGVEFTNGAEQKASRAAVERGLVVVREGKRGAKEHYLGSTASDCPALPPRSVSTVPYTSGTVEGTVNDPRTSETVGVVPCVSCGEPNPTRYHSGGSPRCPDCRAAGVLG